MCVLKVDIISVPEEVGGQMQTTLAQHSRIFFEYGYVETNIYHSIS